MLPAPPNCDGAGSPAPVQQDVVKVGVVVTTMAGELAGAMTVTSRACFKGAVMAPNIFIDGGALAAAMTGGLLLGIDPGTLTFFGSLAEP